MDIRKLWPPDDPTLACVHWDCLLGGLYRKYNDAPAGYVQTRPALICIRGAELKATQSHDLICKPVYDDTFVLCVPTSMPCVFRGASHSYQADSKLSPDINGDGRGDVGTIRPGRFVLRDTGSMPYPVFTVTMPNGSGRLPCWRDIDHDQVISDADKTFSELAHGGPQEDENGAWSDQVLLHSGFDAPADSPHHSSISCLTTQVRSLDVIRGSVRRFGGVLDCFVVDVADVLDMLVPVEPSSPLSVA